MYMKQLLSSSHKHRAVLLQVLEAKRAPGEATSNSPQAAAVQLYDVINQQNAAVKFQVSNSRLSLRPRPRSFVKCEVTMRLTLQQ